MNPLKGLADFYKSIVGIAGKVPGVARKIPGVVRGVPGAIKKFPGWTKRFATEPKLDVGRFGLDKGVPIVRTGLQALPSKIGRGAITYAKNEIPTYDPRTAQGLFNLGKWGLVAAAPAIGLPLKGVGAIQEYYTHIAPVLARKKALAEAAAAMAGKVPEKIIRPVDQLARPTFMRNAKPALGSAVKNRIPKQLSAMKPEDAMNVPTFIRERLLAGGKL